MSGTPQEGSATGWYNVSPNDGANLPAETVGISINAGGNIAAVAVDSTTPTTVGPLPAGFYPVRLRKILATGTTATGIVAFTGKPRLPST